MRKPAGHAEKLAYFYEQVVPHRGEDCLIWPYNRNEFGYGHLSIKGHSSIVSRAVCTIVHGQPPAKAMDAAHSCGNGHLGCVNPSHLRWATRRENMADAIAQGRTPRGEKCGTSKLREAQVREILSLRGIETNISLARRFGVHKVTISKIMRGVRWSHLHETT